MSGGGTPKKAATAANSTLLAFAALPSQVFWVLLLEFLNSYRSFGLRTSQYQYISLEWGLCDGSPDPHCDTDEQTGKLLGVMSTVSVVAGITGSMVTDAIGVRKTALFALSTALVGRSLWVFGRSHLALYLAACLFSPFGDALLSAGLYKVALKKLTPPRLRPLAFAVQYATFNVAGAVCDVAIDRMRHLPTREIYGMDFSGLRLFLASTWVALFLAFLIAIFCLRDYTVVDTGDPESEAELASSGMELPEFDIHGRPLHGDCEDNAADEEEEEEASGSTSSSGGGIYALLAARRRATRRYRLVATTLHSAGAGEQLRAIAKEHGYLAMVSSALRSVGRQFVEVGALRSLWVVIAFSLCTFGVGLLWGDMDSMLIPFLTRYFGEAVPAYTIHSINLWGCLILPGVVALLTAEKETFAVIMPGLWIMALSPLFLAMAPSVPSAALWMLCLTLGEVLWAPRQAAWAATLAPTGREGLFLAAASLKDLCVTWLPPLINGYMNAAYVPDCHQCRDAYGHFYDQPVTVTVPVTDGDGKQQLHSDGSGSWAGVGGGVGGGDMTSQCASTTVARGKPLLWRDDAEAQATGLVGTTPAAAAAAGHGGASSCPSTCQECPGWEGDAATMWQVVLIIALTSPLMVWAVLPFLRSAGGAGATAGGAAAPGAQQQSPRDNDAAADAVSGSSSAWGRSGEGSCAGVYECSWARLRGLCGGGQGGGPGGDNRSRRSTEGGPRELLLLATSSTSSDGPPLGSVSSL